MQHQAALLAGLVGFVGSAVRAGGTGSTPPGLNGWQRPILRTANQLPRSAPCVLMASTAYALHDGANRHRCPSNGLIHRR
jgi:hypothetical protein